MAFCNRFDLKIKRTLVLFSFILSHSLFAQLNYEKGYFIDNNDQRTECFIRNMHWSFNPYDFQYKVTSDDKGALELSIKGVKEFGIYGSSKYVKAQVKLDISSDRLEVSKTSDKRSPEWNEEELFLKVLVEGEATLYSYERRNAKRFFYKVGDSPISQLVYKKYIAAGGQNPMGKGYIGVNKDFLGQLNADVRCGRGAGSAMTELAYDRRVLTKYFKEFNECKTRMKAEGLSDEGKGDYSVKTAKGITNIRIRPGINFSSMQTTYTRFSNSDIGFATKPTFRLGVEAEFILNSKKSTWAVVFEPTYRSFSATNDTQASSIYYPSIEFPLGLRRYFKLSNNSSLFINSAFVFDFLINGTISGSGSTQSTDLHNSINYAFGGGLSVKKFSLEVKYFTSRDPLKNYNDWKNTSFTTTAVILGYKLPSKKK